MPPVLDADMAATLTPEELAAINSEDSPEEKLVMRSVPEGDDDDDSDEQEVGAPVEGAAAKPDESSQSTATEAAATQDAAPAAPQAKASTPPAAQVPQYAAELPADYADKVAELDTRRAKIEADFEAGEVDAAEQRRLLAELSKDRDDLLVVKARADTLQTINDSNRRNAQQEFESAFVARTKNDGVDYSKPKNQTLFNAMLADLAEDNPEQTEPWYWENAHAAVLRSRGLTPATQAVVPIAPKDAVAAAVAARKTPIESAPKTLAQVPGSDGPGDVQGEFADMDALEGLELEDAIRRMTPAAREKYLRS